MRSVSGFVSWVVSGCIVLVASGHDAWAASPRQPVVMAGTLSPVSRRPVAQIATRFVTEHARALGLPDAGSVAEARVHALPEGTTVTLAQTYRGIPVVGAWIGLRLDAQRRVRWAISTARPVPGSPAITPRVPAATAVQVLEGARPSATRSPGALRSALVLVPRGAGLRLAWRIELGFDAGRREALLAYVDAEDTRLLSVENRVRLDRRARVYAENPRRSELAETSLDALAAGAPSLANASFVTQSCIDDGRCLDWSGNHVRACSYGALASADPAGDFLLDRPPFDEHPADGFAEVQAFHHATSGLAWFNAMGFRLPRAIKLIANYRESIGFLCSGPTSSEPLVPMDNAFFTPEGGPLRGIDGPMLAFGQGLVRDWAYDGDVVRHELGHAVVDALTGLETRFVDERGFEPSGGALHEGYADYFAAAMSNNPEMGEYAGSGGAFGLESGAIRSLLSATRLPQDLINEPHEDSLAWSAALWAVRLSLDPAEQETFDRAVYTALTALGARATLEHAARATQAEIELRLGPTVAAEAVRVFTNRGLWSYREMTVRLGDTLHPRPLLLWGVFVVDSGARTVPGPLQYRVELAEPAESLSLSLLTHSETEPVTTLRALAKPLAPVQWTGSGSDAETSAALAYTPEGRLRAELRGPFGVGTHYLALEFAGDTIVAIKDLVIEAHAGPPTPPSDGGAPGPIADAGPADSPLGDAAAVPPDAGASRDGSLPDAGRRRPNRPSPAAEEEPSEPSGGCATAGGPPATGPAWLIGIVLLAAWHLRRHRFDRGRLSDGSYGGCRLGDQGWVGRYGSQRTQDGSSDGGGWPGNRCTKREGWRIGRGMQARARHLGPHL